PYLEPLCQNIVHLCTKITLSLPQQLV
ncbi:putative transport protein, partial [Chlamydia psittaci 06-1683]